MARYSLFVLKMPLNPKQTNNLWSNGTRILTEICQKTRAHRVPPFHVTQGHWD